MIQLFVSDIDGCLSEPYQAMDLPALTRLAAFAKQGGQVGSDSVVPALSICSGRPMSYVACITQMLGICVPVLFESGGGIFDPSTARVLWSPHLTSDVQQQVREVTRWLEKDCVPGTSLTVDYAKRAHAGVVGPDPYEVLATVPRLPTFADASGLDFDVMPTHLSIDIIPKGISKEFGMRWLADVLDLDLHGIAYIGDSLGDLAALRMVGHSFAPENARDVVKEEVDCVTAAGANGVLEAVKLCIARNQQSVEIEELNG